MSVNVVAEPTQGVFMGVPSYFRYACITATSGGPGGGYYWVGHTLASHFEDLCPDDLYQSEWSQILINEIDVLLRERRLAEAEAWLVKRFPRCMKLIPLHARAKFMQGVWDR